MLLSLLLATSFAARSVLSCADHTGHQRGDLSPRSLVQKRANVSPTNPSYIHTDWAYDASYNWGAIRPEYATCQTGTQQSPIALSLASGLSPRHRRPSFANYDRAVVGNWTNWGNGPAFNLEHPEDDYTSLPQLRFDNQTAYLKGWHIHAPAEHTVDGDRSRAEMHLVHVNDEGHEVAVLAIRIDPDTAPSPFLKQLPALVPFPTRNEDAPRVVPDVSMNVGLALDGVDRFRAFWTYRGSFTTPPCREGIRWFVARPVARTSVEQMRALLGACTFSARVQQRVWLQGVSNGA